MAIVRAYGFTCMLRQELGQDISSACGQLVVDSVKKVTGQAGGCGTKDTDIEELMGG
jgi:hypothetical protein